MRLAEIWTKHCHFWHFPRLPMLHERSISPSIIRWRAGLHTVDHLCTVVGCVAVVMSFARPFTWQPFWDLAGNMPEVNSLAIYSLEGACWWQFPTTAQSAAAAAASSSSAVAAQSAVKPAERPPSSLSAIKGPEIRRVLFGWRSKEGLTAADSPFKQTTLSGNLWEFTSMSSDSAGQVAVARLMKPKDSESWMTGATRTYSASKTTAIFRRTQKMMIVASTDDAYSIQKVMDAVNEAADALSAYSF